jgi:arylsulfatase A
MIRKLGLLITLALPIVSLAQVSSVKKDTKGPNVIIIMADDMGKECIGSYGGTYPTPNIDKLAAEGVKFNYAFSQPLCTPSRVQIMTGKYNYKNYTEFGYLDPREKTFAHLAKEAGYTTAIAGKWQLGANSKLPQHFGFDQYCLWQLSYSRAQGERYAKALIEQDGKTLTTTDDNYGPDIFVNYITDFIEKNKDKKFLAYYPMALVHDPFLPTPDSKGWADVSNRHKRDTANFKDMVQYSDKNVGKIIQKLKDLNLYENTVIIFTGDNGTGRSISTPMKDGTVVQGGKSLTIDRGHHVPFIINWGSNRYTSHETDDLVDFTDVLATVSDVVGVKTPTKWSADGVSFYPQLTGKKGKTRDWILVHYNPLHSEAANKNAARFFRDKRYKLYSDGRFYDLQKDIEETTPITNGKGTSEAEKARKTFAAELGKLPAWKPGDPGIPKFIQPGLEPAKSTGE